MLTAPSLSLLCKLGSIAVHTDEMLSATGHEFDRTAIESLLTDPEVSAWLAEMQADGLVPQKR